MEYVREFSSFRSKFKNKNLYDRDSNSLTYETTRKSSYLATNFPPIVGPSMGTPGCPPTTGPSWPFLLQIFLSCSSFGLCTLHKMGGLKFTVSFSQLFYIHPLHLTPILIPILMAESNIQNKVYVTVWVNNLFV